MKYTTCNNKRDASLLGHTCADQYDSASWILVAQPAVALQRQERVRTWKKGR